MARAATNGNGKNGDRRKEPFDRMKMLNSNWR